MDYPINEKVTPPYWKRRNNSKAYRKAYQLLAQKIPLQYEGKVADIACGCGGLLAKIYSRLKKGTLVGTDNSEKMLLISHEFLSAKGIASEIYESPDNVDFNKPGVYLIKDDITNSKLPDNIFSRLFFTFPELGEDYPHLPEEESLINRAICEGLIDSSLAIESASTLIANSHLSRIVKPNGLLIRTNYLQAEKSEKSFYNEAIINWQQELAKFTGFSLIECIFREDEEIYKDTVNYRLGELLSQRAMAGYWTTVMRKQH